MSMQLLQRLAARRTVACALVLGTAALAVGCGSSSDDDDKGDSATVAPATTRAPTPPRTVAFEQVRAGSGAGLTLGYVSAGEAITFNHLVTQSVERSAREAGARVVICDSQGDTAKALDCVKNLKTRGVDGYLLYQLAPESAPQICAAGPDVPVIGVSFSQRPCERANVGASNSYAGYSAGRALGDYFKARFDCRYDAYVSFQMTVLGPPNQDRMKGYDDGFASVCGTPHDVKRLDVATPEEARTQMTDVLTTLPGRDKIIAVGVGDYAIEGALSAAKAAGRTGDLYVSGQGADPSAHCEIARNPQWVAEAAYFPERWGEIGVPRLIDLIRGRAVPADLSVPIEIVDAETIGDHYDLSAC